MVNINIRGLGKRKGSLMVEAAIVLPIFFLAILSLVLTIRLAEVEANTMASISKVSQAYAKEMYLVNLGPVQDLAFDVRVKKQVADQEKMVLGKVGVEKKTYPLRDQGLVKAALNYEIDLALPMRLSPALSFQESLLFRGFVGRKWPGPGFGFDEMERSDNPNGVFVFPRAGERYHIEDCRIIVVFPVEKILTQSLKSKYSPCKICKARDLPLGSKVYCFESSGRVYHKGICPSVDRYVIEIDKEEAIEKGYTACAYCGGQ